MSSSFGTPLSSIPNTSYKNLSSPVSYTGITGSTGMDPLIGASLIGAGGSALAGGASAAGSKKAADKAKSAAEAQAEAIQKASREAPLIGFGMEAAGKQYDLYKGGPMDRIKAFEDAKLEGALAFSPNALARQRLQLSKELAGIRQQAYGKEMDPFSRFV